MKQLIGLLLLFLASTTNAQVWSPQGATWHFEYYNFYLGTVTVSYEGDTTLDNYTAQKLKTVDRSYFQDQNGILNEGNPNTTWNYTAQSGDSIFWWKNGEFFLLYDFGAMPGDSWTIYNNHGSDTLCDSLSIVSVVDTGHVMINSQNLRYIELEMLGHPEFAIQGRAVERLGIVGTYNTAGFVLPLQRLCDTNSIPEYFWWDFICYQDNSFGLYNPAPHSCDYYASIVGIEELVETEKTIVKIYDVTGREIEYQPNTLMIVFYSDGSSEKVFVKE